LPKRATITDSLEGCELLPVGRQPSLVLTRFEKRKREPGSLFMLRPGQFTRIDFDYKLALLPPDRVST
jgi:hypothetical protein